MGQPQTNVKSKQMLSSVCPSLQSSTSNCKTPSLILAWNLIRPTLPHLLDTPPCKKKSLALSFYLLAVGQFNYSRLKNPTYVMQLVQWHLLAGPMKNNACLSPGADLSTRRTSLEGLWRKIIIEDKFKHRRNIGLKSTHKWIIDLHLICVLGWLWL